MGYTLWCLLLLTNKGESLAISILLDVEIIKLPKLPENLIEIKPTEADLKIREVLFFKIFYL